MKIGDLVRWTELEMAYHLATGFGDLSSSRSRGIIIAKNPIYFFVRWENNEIIAQIPDTIEVLSET